MLTNEVVCMRHKLHVCDQVLGVLTSLLQAFLIEVCLQHTLYG